MKKAYKKIVVLILVLATILTSIVIASPATSYTWTINAKNRWTKTQDAYLPEKTIINLGLDGPEDLFVANEFLYIADTGHNRVVVYDIQNELVVRTIALDVFKKPRGIYVTQMGNIYVADSGAEAVFKLDIEGHLLETYKRPVETSYGTTPYKPVKVSVDTKGNMYIIGEGVLNGIIQLSNGGKFLGYFASNRVTLNFIEELQNFFFTEAQMANLQSRVPITMTNTFVDIENTVYSTTIGSEAHNPLAKHNTAGKNTFSENIWAPDDLIDIYVDNNGVIYAASLYGAIWVYTNEGEFIHAFGANLQSDDIAGLFNNLQAIAVDASGQIWAADSKSSYIQSFLPTEYSRVIYKAIDSFQKGAYEEAEALWLRILQKNQMLKLAHESLGKIYFYTERYEEAMKHLEISNSKYFYSQAYWEVRNIWLQRHLTFILLAGVILFTLFKILKLWDKKKHIYKPLRKLKNNCLQWKLVRDLLFVFTFFRHPIDGYYDLKIKKKGSYLSATIIYISFFFLYIHSYIGRGFLFTGSPIEDLDFNALVLGYFGISLLFIYTNYLVTSIQDGEGSIGEIYLLTVYASGPIIVSVFITTILSYFLTYNEVFFMDFLGFISVIWSFVLLVLGLQEIHDYSTRTALKSILYSVGFMLIIAIVFLIVFLMAEQVFDFVEVLFREVLRNVTSS